MERNNRPGGGPPRTLVERALPLVILACGMALGPVSAITVSKLNVTNNTAAASNNQKVSVYGLPPLVQDSPLSAYTTKSYNVRTFAPYPYATSSNTRATYQLSTGSIARNERGSSTLSTVDPAAALTISDWAWYTSNTRLGAVPDPSISRQLGPNSGGVGPNDWISLNLTFRNTLKPVDANGGNPSLLPRPSSRLAYLDFSVGAYRSDRPRAVEGSQIGSGSQLDIERYYSQRSILKVNPNSQGQLAQANDLLRQGSNPFLANNQSSADDGSSAALFVPPIVLATGQQPPVPGPSQPVTAHYLSSTPGVSDTFRIQSANRILTHLELAPGASVTFQVRAMVGVFEGFGIGTSNITPFRPLFITRMREIAVVNGVEITEAAFSGVADYPHDIDDVAPNTRPTVVSPAPLDRQDWAHRLDLYNRILKYHGGAAPAGKARF